VDPPPFPTALDVPKLREPDIKASMQNLRTKTVLRVQCPGTHGINLPQLLERRAYSLRQILHRALQNDWHFYVTCMFQCTNYAIDRGGLLHLTSASLHRSNFIAIDKEIKEISFRELPNPDMRTNTKLLALREVLYELVTGTAETQNYASSYVVKSLDDDSLHSIDSEPVDRLERYSPIERLATITPQASDLQRFLMDSFQLLMSSVSVAETQNAAKQAKLSMEQAERTAKLTQLAFVYIPLTFVTSIFGMNVRELVDPVLPVWVCFVTLVVVAAATAAIFGSYKYRPDNVLRNLLSERYARALGLRGTAVPSQSIDATDTDVEKGPACS
jgi:Mg2+ and Co2+ transporter CorA